MTISDQARFNQLCHDLAGLGLQLEGISRQISRDVVDGDMEIDPANIAAVLEKCGAKAKALSLLARGTMPAYEQMQTEIKAMGLRFFKLRRS